MSNLVVAIVIAAGTMGAQQFAHGVARAGTAIAHRLHRAKPRPAPPSPFIPMPNYPSALPLPELERS